MGNPYDLFQERSYPLRDQRTRRIRQNPVDDEDKTGDGAYLPAGLNRRIQPVDHLHVAHRILDTPARRGPCPNRPGKVPGLKPVDVSSRRLNGLHTFFPAYP